MNIVQGKYLEIERSLDRDFLELLAKMPEDEQKRILWPLFDKMFGNNQQKNDPSVIKPREIKAGEEVQHV